MMSKQNCFKKKPEDPEESPSKKRRIDLKDTRSMETLPEDWMTFQKGWKGPREGMHGPDSGRTSEDIDDQPSNHPDEPESQQAGSNHLGGNLEEESTLLSSQMGEHAQSQSQKRKLKGKAGKQATPPTIGVMFIDQTPGGLLAKNLQEVEDRLAKVLATG